MSPERFQKAWRALGRELASAHHEYRELPADVLDDKLGRAIDRVRRVALHCERSQREARAVLELLTGLPATKRPNGEPTTPETPTEK